MSIGLSARWVALTALIFCLMLAIWLVRRDIPAVDFIATTIDLGRRPAGAALNCDFSFTNRSRDTIVLAGVDISCSCTTVPDNKVEVAPGETGSIPVSILTSQLIRPTLEPYKEHVFEQTVVARFGGGVNVSQPLRVKATLIPLLSLEPSEITISRSIDANPRSTYESHGRGRLHRKALSSSEFSQLQLIHAGSARVNAVANNGEFLDFEVRIDCCEPQESLQPIQIVRRSSSNSIESLEMELGRIRLAMEERSNYGISVFPASAFMYVGETGVTPAELKSATLREFQVQDSTAGSDAIIGELFLRNEGDVNWLHLEQVDETHFACWMTQVPQQHVYRSCLVAKCRRRSGGDIVDCVIPVKYICRSHASPISSVQ